MKFTDEAEDTLSAQRHLDRLVAPIAVVYGTAELEFQRQSRDFAAAVQSDGQARNRPSYAGLQPLRGVGPRCIGAELGST